MSDFGQQQKCQLKGHEGFSLSTVLVGIAIGSILMLGITEFLTKSMNLQKYLQTKVELSGFNQSITTTLADPAICDAAIAGQSLDAAQVQFVLKDKILGSIKAGYIVEGLVLSSFKLVDIVTVDASTVGAKIEIGFDDPKNRLTVPIKKKQMPIYIKVVDGQIAGCAGSDLQTQICEGWGGTYQISNGASRCSLPVNDAIVGSCPAGQIMTGVNDQGKKICRSVMAVILEGGGMPTGGDGEPAETYSVVFKNGVDPAKGKVIGTADGLINDGPMKVVRVGSPAARFSMLEVRVINKSLSVKPAAGYYSQLCYKHNGYDKCAAEFGISNEPNCGLPINWSGDFSGSTLSESVNCGNWGP